MAIAAPLQPVDKDCLKNEPRIVNQSITKMIIFVTLIPVPAASATQEPLCVKMFINIVAIIIFVICKNMKYDPQRHHRRSIRLKGFDYSHNSAYFLTLVTKGRECLFGEISNGEMRLNTTGKIITSMWLGLETRFHDIQLGEFVVMPNHFHAIISVGATLVVAPDGVAPDWVAPDGVAPDGIAPAKRSGTSPPLTLGDIVGAFKSISTHEIIRAVRRGEIPPFAGKIWQRNYYEHIVRSEVELDRIRQYIRDNSTRWVEDRENPA
jgi:putative transposase